MNIDNAADEYRTRIISLEQEEIRQGNRITAVEVEVHNNKETIEKIEAEFKSQRAISRTTLVTALLTLASIFAKFIIGKI